MKRSTKMVLTILLLLVVAGFTVGWVMWHKPKRNVAEEKGIEVTAAQLVKEYDANEKQADSSYLNKAIQVTGAISEMKDNQEGKTTVLLASDDPMAGGVYCTLKEKNTTLKPGATVTIKGVCNGKLSDVRLGSAVVVK